MKGRLGRGLFRWTISYDRRHIWRVFYNMSASFMEYTYSPRVIDMFNVEYDNYEIDEKGCVSGENIYYHDFPNSACSPESLWFIETGLGVFQDCSCRQFNSITSAWRPEGVILE